MGPHGANSHTLELIGYKSSSCIFKIFVNKGFPAGIGDNIKFCLSRFLYIPVVSVFFADVTVSSDKCPGQAWKKTLEVRREFAYTGGQQSITLAAGKYKMECWGAQGPENPGKKLLVYLK